MQFRDRERLCNKCSTHWHSRIIIISIIIECLLSTIYIREGKEKPVVWGNLTHFPCYSLCCFITITSKLWIRREMGVCKERVLAVMLVVNYYLQISTILQVLGLLYSYRFAFSHVACLADKLIKVWLWLSIWEILQVVLCILGGKWTRW